MIARDFGNSVQIEGGQYVVMNPGAPLSVAVFPGTDAFASVEVSVSPTQDVESMRWIPLQQNIDQDTLIVFPGPITAMRLSSWGDGHVTTFDWAAS